MTGPHKILFVIESLNVGGSESFLRDLALRLDRTKFEPVVCCLVAKGRLAEPLEAAGVRVVSLGWRLGSFPSTVATAVRLARFMSAERFDLVQTIYYRPEVIAALASLFVRRPTLVGSQHDVIAPEGRVSRALLRMSGLRVRHVVANCETCRLHRLALTSHRPDQVSVIYMGLRREGGPTSTKAVPSQSGAQAETDAKAERETKIETETKRGREAKVDVNAVRKTQTETETERETGMETEGHMETRTETQSSSALPASGPLVTYAGRLHPIKGPDVFLEAAASLARRRPSMSFLMVGEGPMRGELEARAASMGLAGRIRFPGHVPSMREVLRRSAVFVCSSRSEGFPTVILEAMAEGAPVVASKVGGVPELITHGVNGLLFDSEDHEQLATLVEGLVLDRTTARNVAARARDRVFREFRFEDTVERTQRLYLRLLGEGAP